MPIQYIEQRGVAGFQVRVGPSKKPLTRYFSVAKHGSIDIARTLAEAAERELLVQTGLDKPQQRVRDQNNTSGLVGLNLRYEVFGGDTPYLYVQASWLRKDGRACATKASAQKHGILEAVRICMERREKATGVSYGLTPRRAWNVLRRHHTERT